MTLWPKFDLLRHGPSLNEILTRPMLIMIGVIVVASIFVHWVHSYACVVLLDIQILVTLVSLIMSA